MRDQQRVTLTVEASESIAELFIGFRLKGGEREVLAAEEPPAKVVLSEVGGSSRNESSSE